MYKLGLIKAQYFPILPCTDAPRYSFFHRQASTSIQTKAFHQCRKALESSAPEVPKLQEGYAKDRLCERVEANLSSVQKG